jgi:phage repressor protein C with HTH and peptisase S24 domain
MAKPKIPSGSGIGEKIKRLMEEHPHIKTQTDLAGKTSIAQSTIGRIIRGESMPSADYLQRIASALEADVATILGDGNTSLQSALSRMRPLLTWEHPDDLPPGEFALVKRLAVKLSAGNGHEQVEVLLDQEKQPQAFRADWIRKMGLKPASLACLEATGHSMEPRIQDGDGLVIDRSQTDVQDGRVYALWYDGGERVKRLYRLPGGGLRIASDNPAFAPIDLQHDSLARITILGRVVHVAGEGGL